MGVSAEPPPPPHPALRRRCGYQHMFVHERLTLKREADVLCSQILIHLSSQACIEGREADFIRYYENNCVQSTTTFNPINTGLFYLVVALGGWFFHPSSTKFDPDILEQ